MGRPFLLLLLAVASSALGALIPPNNKYDLNQVSPRQKSLAMDLPGTGGERLRRIPDVITPLHYYVRVRPYFPYDPNGVQIGLPAGKKNMTFDGIQTFIFRVKKDTPTITLHSLNLTYHSIKLLDDNGVELEKDLLLKTTYNTTLHHVIMTPKTKLTVGKTYMVQFDYTGEINDYLTTGLYYTPFKDSKGKVHWIVVTHMEPARARAVFPCLDEPNYKAIFHITLIYPKGLKALANTMERTPVPITAKDYGDGWEVIQFPPSLKMSTYLVAFAIGPFVKQERYDQAGTLVRIWGWTGQEKYLAFAADTSVKCLYQMGIYTDFTYPMPKSDQLGLPQFVAGAMENYGLIIYKYQFIAFDEHVQSTYYKQAAARVICHELAHQWFGDTVTAMWWDDLFLQEGFAAFFENYGMRLAMPEQIPFLEGKFLTESMQGGLNSDANLAYPSHPIYDLDGPFFDDITYLKGSSVLRMIRAVIGPDAFQTALQQYIKMYKFSNANHTMLFERFTAANNGKVKDWCGRPLDMKLFLDPWFYQQGFPEISVENDELMGFPVSTQQPFNAFDTLPESPVYNYSWPVPLFYRFYQSPDKAVFEWIAPANSNCGNKATQNQLAVSNEPIHWNIDNANASSFMRVEYDDIGFDRVIQQLKAKPNDFSIGDKVILMADRLAFMERHVARGEPFSYGRLLDAIDAAIPNYPRFGAVEWVLNTIEPLENMFLDGPDFGLFERFMNKIFTGTYTMLGWNVSGDWDTDTSRYMLFPYAVRYGVGDATTIGQQKFQQILDECKDTTTGVEMCTTVHPDIRIPAYCAGIMEGTQADFDRLFVLLGQQYKADLYFYQEYYAMMEGMACTTRQNDMDKLIKFALTILRLPQNKYKLAKLPYNIIIKNPMAGDWMAEYLLKNPTEILSSENLGEYLAAITSVWHTSARLYQFDIIVATLNGQMNDNQRTLFTKYRNVLAGNLDWRSKYFPDLSRNFYDRYVIGPFEMENWNTKLPIGLEPISYDLEVKPHIPGSAQYPWYKNMTFDGKIKMNLTATQEMTQFITINAHRMVLEASNIHLQKADGTGAVYTPKTIEKDFELAFLRIPIGTLKLMPGEVWTLSIDYTGFIWGKPCKGVYTNTNFFEFNGKMAWIFSTYFESGPSARSLAPCFDQPNYKATWTMTVHHPADMKALSNMPAQGFSVQPEGWSTTYFPTTPKMSSYLIAMAAGHFASLQTVSQTGHLVRTWAWTGMERYAETALKAAAGTVDFLSTYFKYPYMLPKLDVLALPQYTTMHGAEEHWGFIHILYRYMLADKQYATSFDYADIASITSHETVHQWFGNLVTIEFWPYIFLNEAFANYWETNAANHTFPEQAANNKLERFRKAYSGFSIDSSVKTSKPVVPDGPKYFTGEPYNKGATLLYMMSQALGAPVFQEGLQEYLRTYEYKNVVPKNLFDSLTVAAQKHGLKDWNGQPLDMNVMMGAWIFQATYPVLKVTKVGQQVTYSQEPFINDTASLEPSTYGWLWEIPVHSQTPKGLQFHYFHGKTGGNDAIWKRSFDGNWQIDNAALGGFYRVWYDGDTWSPIMNQLITDPSKFDVLTRALLVSDTIALQQRGSLKWDRVLQMGLYLAKETDYAPYYAFRPFMNQLITNFRSNSASDQSWSLVRAYLTKAIQPIYERVGWTNTSDWAYNFLALSVTDYACKLDFAGCRQQASIKFNNFCVSCERSKSGTGLCNSVSPDLRRTQYCYGVRANADKFGIVSNLYRWFTRNSKYFNRDTENLLEAQACTKAYGDLDLLIGQTLIGELPANMINYIATHDESKNRLWAYYLNNQNNVRFGVPKFTDYFTAAMSQWNTEQDVQAAREYVNMHPAAATDDEIVAIKSAIAEVDVRLQWLAKNKVDIINWMKSNAQMLYE